MNPDKTLEIARAMVVTWEQAVNTDAEHAAARELSSAFGALDDWLAHGGSMPSAWRASPEPPPLVLAMVHEFIAAAAEAMEAEDVDPAVAERISNRLLWGHPAGADGVAAEAASKAMHPSTGIYGAAGDEVLTPVTWHELTGNPVLPELTHPVFSKDFREIDLNSMNNGDIYPLLATCSCGEEIMCEAPDEPWSHTDPRLP